jgi:hypothetical protein
VTRRGDPFQLYHWSPTTRRPSILRRGLVPGSWSTDRLWRPPHVCFSDNPQMAWNLSGLTARGREVPAWDLWMMSSDVPAGYEEILDTYPDTGRAYVKEYRVYERVFKRDLWWVASR